MDPRKLNDILPGVSLEFQRTFDTMSEDEVKYLYNLTGDEDFSEAAFARAKDMSVDALMTNFVQAFKYEDAMFAGDIVLPPKSVRSRTGDYKKRGKEALDVTVSDTGSDKGETNEILMKVGTGTYSINIYKLKIFVSDDEIKETGPLNAIQEATILLRHGLDLRSELRVRNLAEATTNAAAVGAVWNTGNTVHADVAAAKNALALATGQPATHILMREDVVNLMMANAALDSALFGTVPSPSSPMAGLTNTDSVSFPKTAWGLKVVIPNVYYSTAVGPADDVVPAIVWPKSTFLFRIDNSTRSAMWGFQPELLPLTIVRWRDEDRGGWFIKAVRKRTKVEANADGIYEITGVIA